MKDDFYTVVFTNWNFEKVIASSRKQAIILAQAEQIKKGNSFMVNFVKNAENKVV